MISMGHTCLLVNNIEETIAWYNQHFGFELKVQYNLNSKQIAFISLPNVETNQIELLKDPSITRKITDAPIHHFCLETNNFMELYKRLKKANISFESNEPARTGQGNKTIYLQGLNGERIQLFEKLI